MADAPPPSPPGPSAGAWRFGFRFSPQAIVIVATGAAMFYAAQGAVMGFVHAYWNESFRQVAFVMEDWHPNEGSPYVSGRLADAQEPSPFHLPGAEVGGRRVLEEAPSVAYEPGATVRVWYSSEAPTFAYNRQWTNAVPVAALPERPGWGRFAVHALMTLAIAIVGMRAAWWVFQRYAIRAGTLPVRRT